MQALSITHKKRIGKWIKALLSGEYQQGTGRLKRDGNYCCLGVACDVYRKTTKKGRWFRREDAGDHSFLKAGAQLPEVVSEWFGLDQYDPIVGHTSDGPARSNPVGALMANDNLGWTFAAIGKSVAKIYKIPRAYYETTKGKVHARTKNRNRG